MTKSFAELGVPADLVAVLDSKGITKPFPIQEATLSDALEGRDVCGRAPTGSGKTLAFSVPLVDRIERARPKQPRGLVLVPTRELAAQVQVVIEPLARARGLRVGLIYGGVGFEPQLKMIRRGVDIIVACPGRLLDLLARQALSLNEVDFVVLDEADRMADMGFLPDVRRILDQTNDERQTLLFSATLDNEVDVLIKRYQKAPVHHEVVREDDEEDNVLHLFWNVPRQERASLTGEVLKKVGPTIIFTRTKHGADRLTTQLERQGVQAAAIHGGRSQPQRDRALGAFTAGRVQALVATDVAARGIHVDEVDCVIHYDAPDDSKTYVHRSGRTGRAGAEGIVITMVDADKIRYVAQMQRKLQMAAGVISPDFRALPHNPARRVPSPGAGEESSSSEGTSQRDRRRGQQDGRARSHRRPSSSRRRSQSPEASKGGGGRPRNRRRRPAA